jgi:glycosyltransferase involved in cell wall biosynthesis
MPEHPELRPIANEPISVVLPTWNEEAALAELVTGWATYLDSLGRDYELLVVDDASTDRTGPLLDALAQQFGRVQPLRHDTHQGLGAALRTGIAAARHPLLFYTDGDSAHQPADFRLLLDEIDKVHLVSGVRRGVAVRDRGRWGARAYRWFTRWIFGVRLLDVDCPFKLFRRSIFARIPIQAKGPFVHAEMVAKANFLGCLITEVPLPEQPRTRPRPALEIEPLKQTLREANWIFHHPDFGPAVLQDDQEPAPAPAAEGPVEPPLPANPEIE